MNLVERIDIFMEDFADSNPKNKWVDVTAKYLSDNPEILPQLFDLVQTAYAKIGGHLKIKKPEDLLRYIGFFQAVDIDSDPDADVMKFGKVLPAGKKTTGTGHDGSEAAKKESVKKTAELLKSRGFFSEMSSAIAHIMITRHKVPFVNDKQSVEKAIGKTVEWIGPHPKGKYPGYDGWYRRSIGGESHLKILLGRPK